jgi:hypothetical protein
MRLFKIATMLAGLASGGGVTAANAGTYAYTSYGPNGSDHGTPGENIRVTDTALRLNNQNVGSGLITLNGSTELYAYCVDIATWLLSKGTYNTGVNPNTNLNLTGNFSTSGDSKIALIGRLIYNGTNNNSAAVQLAIWEIEYGSGATFTPQDPGLQGVVNTYIADAETTWGIPSNLALFELTAADGQTNQTLVYLAPVPAPGTSVLLGGAIFLTGLLVRRCRGGGSAKAI